MLQSLPFADTLPCPYCRRPLRPLLAGAAGLSTGFECDACGSFPNARDARTRYSVAVGTVSHISDNRRQSPAPDRRMMPRGGRRDSDVNGQHPPVLVGDSDPSARRVLTRALERFSFRVVEAATGEDALALALESSPSVVVAESTLPRDDELQAFIRANSIPYIVTTTNDLGVVPADAVAVLEKPFPLEDLMAQVFRVVRTNGAPVAA